MYVINLFGVPGVGKSTGAAYIFSKLKMQDINAELVTEFAKNIIWENNLATLEDYAYIFGVQSRRISRCQNKVDVVITDAPLFCTVFYNQNSAFGEQFNKVVVSVFNSYNNINYFVDQERNYNSIGRLQTEKQARAMKKPMLNMLKKYNINFEIIDGDTQCYDLIVKKVIKKLEAQKLSLKCIT